MNKSRRSSGKKSSRNPGKASASRALTGVRLTDALVAGWRPLQRFEVAGFALFRSGGVTKRANSAVALDAPEDAEALLEAIGRVEQLCEMAGDKACFRIMSTHGPAQLDALLAGRGYTVAGQSTILSLSLTGAREFVPHTSAEIRAGELDDDWFDAAWHLAPREGEGAREATRSIMAATPAVQVMLRPAGAEAAEPDEVVAVGRAALAEVGKLSVAVLNVITVAPEHRRQGLGRAVSETLLAVAAAHGVERVLLEVERDNAPAIALYRGLGFEPLGEYHYRVAGQ
ncbi:GNAT family N-acetyltransferase [Tessaracoccus terricola]